MYVDLYQVDLLYGRLLTTEWSAIPFSAIQGLLEIIGGFRERVLFVQKLLERVEQGYLDGPETIQGLIAVCKNITTLKKAFESRWDELVDSLSEVRLVKTKGRMKSRGSKA